MAKFRLDNKVAVITGGGSGIGRAMSLTFAEAGAKVIILEIATNAAQDVSAEILAHGGHSQAIHCDITDFDQVTAVVDDIAKQDNIDILINNAGIAQVGRLGETSPAEFTKVMQVNVTGMYHCLYAIIPKMQSAGGGVILNVASTVASVAIPARFAYTTSKGAVLALTKSVALDYVKENIRCNAISPGRVHTPFVDGFIAKHYPGNEDEMFAKLSSDHPIGRMAQPQEVADLALFLCCDEASYITGSNHQVDGGFVDLRPL